MRFATVALLVAVSSFATMPAAAAPHLVRVLPNKMTVIVRENRTRPLVSVQVWVNAGSRNESRSERGAAEVLAYLPFEETSQRKRDTLAKEAQSFGGSYRSEAGYSQIAYHMTVPARHLGHAIDILSDAVLHPSFNAYTVEHAIARARSDSRIALRSVSAATSNPIRAALYGDSPLGSPATVPELEVAALTLSILEHFYKENYTAENVTLVVVGDVEAEDVASRVAKAFQDLPRGKGRAKGRGSSSPLSGPSIQWVPAAAGSEGNAVSAGFRGPAWGSADAIALDVLMAALVDAPGSRLERRLREGTAESAVAYARRAFTPDGGVVSLSVTAEPGRMADVEGMLVQEIEKIRSQPITQEECDAATRSVVARELSGMGELWGLGRATAIAFFQGKTGADEIFARRIQAVRPEDLTGVAQKYLDWKNAAVVEMMPQTVADSLGLRKDFEKRFREKLSLYQGTYRSGPQATASTEDARRARIDQPLATIAATPFDAGRGRVSGSALPGGIRVLASEDHSIPAVTVAVYLGGGVRYENDKTNGITSLLRETMLNSNDHTMKGLTYRQSLSLMGALVPYQDRDVWGVSLSVPASDWKKALGRIGAMLANPDLDSITVDATRIYLLTAYDKWEQDDEAQRQRLIFATKYEVSGYRLPGVGNRANLVSLPLSTLQAYHKKMVVRPNLVVAVFGDISSSDVAPAVEESFRDIQATRFAPGPIPMDLPFEGFREKWELGAGPNTTVQLAFNGPRVGSPDMPSMYVISSLLSGPYGWFTKHVKSETFVVDVTAMVAQAVDESPIIATATVEGTVREENAVKLMFRQFHKVAGVELTGSELTADLDAAKVHAVGTYLASLTSNTSRAFQWARAELFGLPQDYVLTLPSRMEAVTSSDIRSVGKRYFQKGDWEKHPYAIAETRPGGW